MHHAAICTPRNISLHIHLLFSLIYINMLRYDAPCIEAYDEGPPNRGPLEIANYDNPHLGLINVPPLICFLPKSYIVHY